MSQQAAVAADALHTPADQVRVNRHRADWRGWKFMWPFALVFVFVFVIPILYAIYISFFQKQMIGGTKFVGISNTFVCSATSSSGARWAGSRCSRACRCRSCCVSCRRRWPWRWIP